MTLSPYTLAAVAGDDTSPLGDHAPWLFLDGFPILLSGILWLLSVLLIVWVQRSAAPRSISNVAAAHGQALQNRIYKRAGGFLLVLGAVVGFLPSLVMLARKGTVWSVNQMRPHDEADSAIMVHIPLAVIWAIAMSIQIWSGGSGRHIRLHRFFGWVAVIAGSIGISIAAGLVWTWRNDFADGVTSERGQAGLYTVIMGLGLATNIMMLVVTARRRDFAAHKDYALMALFWSLDPGIHRAYMWTMRMFDWDCWAPDKTSELGIALAKLPANLTMIIWAMLMALAAGRVNRIILTNVCGQLFLFVVSSLGLMQLTFGPGVAFSVTLVTLLCSAAALFTARHWQASDS